LSAESQRSFWHLCPDFVIELRSQSDRLPVLREKMRQWIENGARLA
jgi:Uma2 family endonuclease